MQERVRTSFIPKTSLSIEQKKPSTQSSFGLVNAIAIIILIASIVAAGALFGFQEYIKRSIDAKSQSLERARAAFEPKTIATLIRLDTRLDLGTGLLDYHLAPSYIFEEIERLTLESVRFRSFSFSEKEPGVYAVSMEGEAKSFNALALQSDSFGDSGLFLEPIFDGLNINETGNVVFSFDATVDSELIQYRLRGQTPTSDQPTP